MTTCTSVHPLGCTPVYLITPALCAALLDWAGMWLAGGLPLLLGGLIMVRFVSGISGTAPFLAVAFCFLLLCAAGMADGVIVRKAHPQVGELLLGVEDARAGEALQQPRGRQAEPEQLPRQRVVQIDVKEVRLALRPVGGAAAGGAAAGDAGAEFPDAAWPRRGRRRGGEDGGGVGTDAGAGGHNREEAGEGELRLWDA